MHCLRNSVCFSCSLIIVDAVCAGANCLAKSCGQELVQTPAHHAGLSPEVSSRIQSPLGAVLLPLAQVPRQTGKKETGGGGATTQAGHVQHGTAQRCPGKVGGAHGQWDFRASSIRSASKFIVFIMRAS